MVRASLLHASGAHHSPHRRRRPAIRPIARRVARRAVVAAVCGSLLAALTPVPAGATFPGTNGKIAFASDEDGDFEIFTINPDGTGLTQLTTNAGIVDRVPAWSPDGSKIAWSSSQDGGDWDIWVMNADGTNPTQLTFNGVDDSGAAWSPDGTKIAFGSPLDGDWEIYVINADSTGQTQITTNGIFDCCPDWSPDGTKIVYQPFPGGTSYDIWVMNADGTGQSPLAADVHYEVGPRWAPDGSSILYAKDFGNGSGWAEVFRMNADGTSPTNLTNTCCIWESDANYSPDGSKIVFITNEAAPFLPDFDLYLMNADGTGKTLLYAQPGSQQSDLSWAPAVSLYAFAGFFSPVDNLPVFNSVKAGRGVPVKFSLGGDQGLDIFAAGYPKSQTVTCDSDSIVDGIESTVTTGQSSLSYDPASDRYTYTWKTDKTWAGSCRQLVLKLNDGSSHRANFLFN